MALRDEVNQRATDYWNETIDSDESQIEKIPMSVVDFVIEFFKNSCGFPSDTKEEEIEKVLSNHKSEMSMACINVLSHVGFEGQLANSESGIVRTYDSAWISKQLLSTLPNYVTVFS